MTSAAGAVCALALSAGSAAAQTAQGNVLQAHQGRISPFYGRLSPFAGDVNPLWGRLSPFAGDVDPFWGRMSPFSGDITQFWGALSSSQGRISPFYGNVGSFWTDVGPAMDNLSATWRTVDTSPAAASALGVQFQDLITRSETFWGAAVQAQTGQSFRDGFAAGVFARYGIDPTDPSTFEGFSDVDRARFLFAWYDGLMEFSGRDHVDHWMATTNWNPALSQNAGGGQGVTIGMFDFSVTGAEMSDDVSAWLRGGYNNGGQGHGDAVASLLVADHDGRGAMGIAPNAALVGYNPFDASGTTNWGDIADGVARLKQSGASVVNFSLGLPGSTFAPDWMGLYSHGSVKGVLGSTVFVHAAGNEGVAQTQNINWNFNLDPTFIVVGSVGPTGVISPFSNTPGTACLMNNGVCQERLMDRFIVAPGEWILTSDGQGGLTRQSGTSFSAPMVSGAIALLQSHWPWLRDHAGESADIILMTATDLGAPGVDPVYGRGMLNIAASQAPINMASLYQRSASGQRVNVNLAADGDAVALLGAQDGFVTVYEDIGATYRDFRIPLTANLSSVNSSGVNAGSVLTASLAGASAKIKKRNRFASEFAGEVANPFGWDVRMSLSPLPAGEFVRDGQLPYAFDMMLAGEGGFTLFAGRGYGAVALSGHDSFEASSFTAGTGGANPILGFASGGGYVAADVALGAGFSLSGGVTERRSQAYEADFFTGEERPVFERFAPYRSAAAHALLRKSMGESGFSVSAAYTYLRETNGLLGLQSVNPDDFAAGTQTDAATFGLDWTPSERFGVALSATFGRIRGSAGQSLAISDEGVDVSAFEAAFDFNGVFGANDHARLRIGQPLHVDGGSLNVTSIDVVDRDTGAFGAVTQRVELGGSARQYFIEGAYAAPLFEGQGEIAAIARLDTSSAGADAQQMLGARFSLNF
ncbi:MAG: S8 family serine peptidase [Phycisphaerales bacterium]|nr:S8 family serine peptidase [Hyphomonadaceae bacterium]